MTREGEAIHRMWGKIVYDTGRRLEWGRKERVGEGGD